MIYADHAATTRLSERALEAMLPWLRDGYANASQPYSFSRGAKKAIAGAREQIAACIGAEPDEIFFTSGGTESDNWAIKSTMLLQGKGSEIITSAIEHHAVLNSARFVERLHDQATYLLPQADGVISPSILAEKLSARTRLVSIMLANNEVGTIEPIRELASIAHSAGVLFHTDAVQAMGHIPIDMRELRVDMLSASAHKFNGPKGVGFLYCRKGLDLPPFMEGGAQEKKHRAGTENVAGIVGMATALEENCTSLSATVPHVTALETELLRLLSASGIPFYRNGAENHLPGLLSLSFPGHQGEALLHRLDLQGICISTGSACDSVRTQISHVLQAIGLDPVTAQGTIRISLGKENCLEEIRKIASSLVRGVAV